MLRWHFDDLTQEDTGFSSQQEGREGGREGGGRDTETHRDGDRDRQTDSKSQTDRQSSVFKTERTLAPIRLRRCPGAKSQAAGLAAVKDARLLAGR